MSKEKIVIGVVAGLVAGAVLGVLLAPNKGADSRKKIARQSAAAVDDVKETFSELLRDFTDKFEAARRETVNFIEKGRKELKSDLSGNLTNHKV